MPKRFQWISYSLIFLFSCTETYVPSRGSLDWDFLPLETGVVSFYKVDRLEYLGRGIIPVEEIYFTKEEILSQEIFEDGSILFTILESRDQSGEWIPIRYYTVRKEFDKAVSIIDNIETVELKVPLLNGLQWEGRNLPGNCPDGGNFCDYFEVADKDKPLTIEGIEYSRTARIVKQNSEDPLKISSDLIEFDIYAQNSGLIYSEKISREYASCRNGQNEDCCCPGSELCTLCAGEIEFGIIQKKSLLERILPN